MYITACVIAYFCLPLLCCLLNTYSDVVFQQHKIECEAFLGISTNQQTKYTFLNIKQAKFPSNNHINIRYIDYLPIISFFWLIAKTDPENKIVIIQYFLLEITILAFVYYATSISTDLYTIIFNISFFLALFSLAYIDAKAQILPDIITLPTLWLGLLASLTHFNISPQTAILGAVCGYTIPWLLAKIFNYITRKDAIGYGDFKMIAMLGSWIGMLHLVATILLAAILFIMTFLGLVLCNKRHIHDQFAFGPFLAVAGFIAFTYPQAILFIIHIFSV